MKGEMFDKLQAHYLNNSPLSPKEQIICKRLEMAGSLLNKHRSKRMAVPKLIALVEAEGNTLSRSQAYEDMKFAESLFYEVNSYSKQTLRYMIVEEAINDSKQASELATIALSGKHPDIKAWERAMNIKDKAEQRIIKASGLATEDPELPDFSAFDPGPITSSLPQSHQDFIENCLKNGVVDLNGFFSKEATDVTNLSAE